MLSHVWIHHSTGAHCFTIGSLTFTFYKFSFTFTKFHWFLLSLFPYLNFCFPFSTCPHIYIAIQLVPDIPAVLMFTFYWNPPLYLHHHSTRPRSHFQHSSSSYFYFQMVQTLFTAVHGFLLSLSTDLNFCFSHSTHPHINIVFQLVPAFISNIPALLTFTFNRLQFFFTVF